MSENPNAKRTMKLVPFKDQESAITLYAVLSVLKKMRRELGLEAMLEYMDFYQKLIEDHNPQFRQAVEKALELISIEKVYKDAIRNGEKNSS
jgi:hypothetical protein